MKSNKFNSFIIQLIRAYQNQISSYTKPKCRYVPTCSRYAITSIEQYGTLKGGVMAFKRIIRCNPFAKGGYDPVPDDKYISLRKG